jgi:S-DNA-T family DNA segregation ATPase FtsK/SpoIIIE
LSVLFDFFASVPELGGTVGYELNLFLHYIGKTGTLLTLIFGLILYVIFLNLNSLRKESNFSKTKKEVKI